MEIRILAHFQVGDNRTIFTGRPVSRGRFDLFAVEMGVALVTCLMGLRIGGKL